MSANRHFSWDERIRELLNKANSNIIKSLREITDPWSMSIEINKDLSQLLLFDGHGKAGIIIDNATLKLYDGEFSVSRGAGNKATLSYIKIMHLLSPEEFDELVNLLILN